MSSIPCALIASDIGVHSGASASFVISDAVDSTISSRKEDNVDGVVRSILKSPVCLMAGVLLANPSRFNTG